MYLLINLNNDIFLFNDILPSIHTNSPVACNSDISPLVKTFIGFHTSWRMLIDDNFCSLLILDKIKLKK